MLADSVPGDAVVGVRALSELSELVSVLLLPWQRCYSGSSVACVFNLTGYLNEGRGNEEECVTVERNGKSILM